MKMRYKIAIGVGTAVAAGAITLAGAGAANGGTPCEVSSGSVTCTTTNGSFSAAYSPDGDYSVSGTQRSSSFSRTREGSVTTTTVTLGDVASASLERDWETGEFSATATLGERTATVSGTVGESLSVDVD
jgi:hypothetical protein